MSKKFQFQVIADSRFGKGQEFMEEVHQRIVDRAVTHSIDLSFDDSYEIAWPPCGNEASHTQIRRTYYVKKTKRIGNVYAMVNDMVGYGVPLDEVGHSRMNGFDQYRARKATGKEAA